MRTNLIQERKNFRYTQNQLAKKLGLSNRHYQSLEAGTSDGSVRIWRNLSNIFGKTIDYLLLEDGEKTNEKF